MTDTDDRQHRSILQRIAHRIMLERGLVTDFPLLALENALKAYKATNTAHAGVKSDASGKRIRVISARDMSRKERKVFRS
jgi:hypothetical protein